MENFYHKTAFTIILFWLYIFKEKRSKRQNKRQNLQLLQIGRNSLDREGITSKSDTPSWQIRYQQ